MKALSVSSPDLNVTVRSVSVQQQQVQKYSEILDRAELYSFLFHLSDRGP